MTAAQAVGELEPRAGAPLAGDQAVAADAVRQRHACTVGTGWMDGVARPGPLQKEWHAVCSL